MPPRRISRNHITITQLQIACRHFQELRTANVTENYAIRTLELFVDSYSKILHGSAPIPHHVDHVKLWSIQAQSIRNSGISYKPRDYLRVEHGTPKRALARLVFQMFEEGRINEENVNALVSKHWKLAVITIEEDIRLNKTDRSTLFETPDERWAAAGISFS